MAAVVRVEGAEKLALIGKALRHMGTDRTIIKNLVKRLKSLGPDVRKAIRESAVANLPRRNGLGAWVAKSSVIVSVTRGARNAGVTIVVGRNSGGNKRGRKTGLVIGRARSDIAAIDAGGTRHPLWGNRAHWYPQRVTPGFASKVVAGPVGDAFLEAADGAINDSVAEVLRVL